MVTSRTDQLALRCASALTLGVVVIAGAAITRSTAQQPATTPTKEDLAKDNKLFLTLARQALKWDEPTEPNKIV